jgi:hypothetical protein
VVFSTKVNDMRSLICPKCLSIHAFSLADPLFPHACTPFTEVLPAWVLSAELRETRIANDEYQRGKVWLDDM